MAINGQQDKKIEPLTDDKASLGKKTRRRKPEPVDSPPAHLDIDSAALSRLVKEDPAAAESLALRLLDRDRQIRLAAAAVLAGSSSKAALEALISLIAERKIWAEGSSSYIDGAWITACEALKTYPRTDVVKRLLDRISIDEIINMLHDEAWLGNLWREQGIDPEIKDSKS